MKPRMERADHDDARAHLDRAQNELAEALALFDGVTHPVVCCAEGAINAAQSALALADELLEMGS